MKLHNNIWSFQNKGERAYEPPHGATQGGTTEEYLSVDILIL